MVRAAINCSEVYCSVPSGLIVVPLPTLSQIPSVSSPTSSVKPVAKIVKRSVNSPRTSVFKLGKLPSISPYSAAPVIIFLMLSFRKLVQP